LRAGDLMKRILASIAALSLVASPAFADFSVSQPKPAKPAKAIPPPAPRPVRTRTPVERPRPVATRPPAPLPGIDPAVMLEAIAAAGYRDSAMAAAADGGPKIDVKAGKSAWQVEFSDCATANRCRAAEIVFTWEVMNDANICLVWEHYITQDEDGTKGLPLCKVIPPSGKMLRLSLSTNQAPYAGIYRATREEAAEQLTTMVRTWANYAGRLTEARDIANKKCPRGRLGCWSNEPEKPGSPARRRTTGMYR
jgi:hypothetical protein